MKKDLISIVVPCHDEEEVLPYFIEEIEKVYTNMHSKYGVEFEYIFIDDGSKDGTLSLLRKMAGENKKVNYLSFSRNFGKEAGMLAGFENAAGEYTVIMDADLQDPPHLIEEMYKELSQSTEYDCIATCRVTRKGESKIRSAFAHLFYKVMHKLSGVNVVDGARDFRMMRRDMIDAIISLDEYNRFSKGIFAWVGFNTKWLPYENINRKAGTTKWSFFGLCAYAIDGIVAFSTGPLLVSTIIGLLLFFVAIAFILIIIWKTFAFGETVKGWPSTACIIILIGGLILFFNGITGIYVSKIYSEVKHRPKYIIKSKKINHENEREEK